MKSSVLPPPSLTGTSGASHPFCCLHQVDQSDAESVVRQPHHVVVAALDALDERAAEVLDPVAAGLAPGVVGLRVELDRLRVDLAELDEGLLLELLLEDGRVRVLRIDREVDARDNGLLLAAEARDHLDAVRLVDRLLDNLVVDQADGVRADQQVPVEPLVPHALLDLERLVSAGVLHVQHPVLVLALVEVLRELARIDYRVRYLHLLENLLSPLRLRAENDPLRRKQLLVGQEHLF